MLLEEFPFESGFRLMDGDLLNKVAVEPAYSVDNAVTATGTAKATAYNLRATMTVITAGGDQTGVRLPTPKVGRVLYVMNFTATGKRVYPNDLETVNGTLAGDLPFGMGVMLACISPSNWVAALVAANTASGDVVAVASDADTATGDGHFVQVMAGAGGTTSGNGGAVTIASGPAAGNPGNAGDILIQAANATAGQGGDVTVQAGTGTSNGRVIFIAPVMLLPNLQASASYANDAAAATGGVPVGGAYRTGSAVMVRIV